MKQAPAKMITLDLCFLERDTWVLLLGATSLALFVPFMAEASKTGRLLGGKGTVARGWNPTVRKARFVDFYLLAFVLTLACVCDEIATGGRLFVATLQSHSSCAGARAAGTGLAAEVFAGECLLCLMLLHVQAVRRLVECLVVHRFGEARMSVLGYLVGMLHYTAATLTFVVEAPRPVRLAVALRSFDPAAIGAATAVRHLAAVALFTAASLVQHHAHVHLASLRNGRWGKGAEKEEAAAAKGPVGAAVAETSQHSGASAVTLKVRNEVTGAKTGAGVAGAEKKAAAPAEMAPVDAATAPPAEAANPAASAAAVDDADADDDADAGADDDPDAKQAATAGSTGAAAMTTAVKPTAVMVDGSTYGLPTAGGFRYVSCPHYTAEIAIYASLALATGGRSGGALLMLAWVAANQSLTAARAHEWYVKAFPGGAYPRERRRLVLWLW